MLNFDHLFPEVAAAETRCLVVKASPRLPDDTYVLREFYCEERGCDCRRVILQVNSSRSGRTLAGISYGFDRMAEDAGPFIDPLNPRTRHAEALLDLVRETALADRSYVARLERHYRIVKDLARDPSHPSFDRLPRDPDAEPRTVERDEPKVGRNDPCPCGSGKKYKKCCLRSEGAADTASRAAPRARAVGIPYHGGPDDPEDRAEHDEDTCVECGARPDGLSRYAALRQKERRGELRGDGCRQADAERLSVDEHLRQIRSAGLDVSRESFIEAAGRHTSAWALSREWVDSLPLPTTESCRDFFGLAACVLWRRLCADRPSQEMLQDWIDEGRASLESDTARAHELWWDAWQVVRSRLTPDMRTIERAAPVFEASSLRDWLSDFAADLYEASLVDRDFAPRAVELHEQVLAAFPDDDEGLLFDLRADLGELLFLVGRAVAGTSVLHRAIDEDPTRGLPYVRLAEALEAHGEAALALELLERAREVVVDDPDDVDLELPKLIAALRARTPSHAASAGNVSS